MRRLHPRGRRRVLHQPGQGAPARPARAAGRYRPRPRDALGHRPGQGRGDPAVQAPRAAPVRRGGRGPRQVPAPPAHGPRPRWCACPPSSSGRATSSARSRRGCGRCAMQATAADRAAKLAGEIAVGRVTLLSSEILSERRSSAGLDARRAVAAEAHARWSRSSPSSQRAARRPRPELTGLAAAQERAAHAFYAFETARERLGLQIGRVRPGVGIARAGPRPADRRRRAARRRRRALDAPRPPRPRPQTVTSAAEIEQLGTGDLEAERRASRRRPRRRTRPRWMRAARWPTRRARWRPPGVRPSRRHRALRPSLPSSSS